MQILRLSKPKINVLIKISISDFHFPTRFIGEFYVFKVCYAQNSRNTTPWHLNWITLHYRLIFPYDKKAYVYELPFCIILNLCLYLPQGNCWIKFNMEAVLWNNKYLYKFYPGCMNYVSWWYFVRSDSQKT